MSINYPTLIEYQLGNGRVIASTQTWEHNYAYTNAFGRKALDDVFLYAFSGGAIPSKAKVELRIEDEPNWMSVNKSKGSYVDVVARVSGDQSYEANVILQVPDNKFGAPVKTFTRNRPDNSGYSQENQVTNQGDGRYKITTTLASLASTGFYREAVWRFKVPDNIPLQSGVQLIATLSVPEHVVQKGTSSARLNIIDQAKSLIVTNRKLLFDKYQSNSAQNEVSSLLEEVYRQANSYGGEVFYVDLYNDAARSWNQDTNENSANATVTQIDGLINNWYNRLTKRPQPWQAIKPEYLLIVGGDEIIPFYRADDDNYNSCTGPNDVCEEDVVRASNSDPVLNALHDNYFFTDNVYADVGGGLSDWEKGQLELSTGRIVGASATDMRRLIENSSLRTGRLKEAVLASMQGSQVNGMVSKLNNRHVAITGLSNPNMVANNNWTRSQWLDA